MIYNINVETLISVASIVLVSIVGVFAYNQLMDEGHKLHLVCSNDTF
jgi:hypothetical protein